MNKDQEFAHQLFQALQPEKLIAGKGFFAIPEGQIIFYHEPWQAFVITTVSEDMDYHVGHYDLLPENDPFQLIKGKLIYMAAPNVKHHRVQKQLIRLLDNFIVDNKLGELFWAPIDVQLSDADVVQPDVFFVSIKQKNTVSNNRVFGAPEFIVEILSTNENDDRIRKMQLYGERDVLEYWIVSPEAEKVEVYHNQAKEMKLVQTAGKGQQIKSISINGLVLDVDRVFDF